jgi:preprotein translocase subunit SecE
VARNRKRRSAGRARRPGDGSAPGVATASGDRSLDAPDPLEHATPDVELAEAQLALGRPKYVEEQPAADEPGDEESPDDERFGDEPIADEPAGEEPAGGGGGDDYDEDDDDLGSDEGGPGGRRESVSTAVSAPRENPGRRLVHFVQGSWRELQRVQWPDRRQVMQATGVVIGFVIVAGVFLGVADFVATKIVKLILP